MRRAGFTILDNNPDYFLTAVARFAGVEYKLGLNIVEGEIPIIWEYSPLTSPTIEFIEQSLEDEEVLKIKLKQQGSDD